MDRRSAPRRGEVPPGPALEHAAGLVEAGATATDIAFLAGLNGDSLRRRLRHPPNAMRAEVAAALLGVTPEHVAWLRNARRSSSQRQRSGPVIDERRAAAEREEARAEGSVPADITCTLLRHLLLQRWSFADITAGTHLNKQTLSGICSGVQQWVLPNTQATVTAFARAQRGRMGTSERTATVARARGYEPLPDAALDEILGPDPL
jgi:lambda repressor-like predicted transcriptional regulator